MVLYLIDKCLILISREKHFTRNRNMSSDVTKQKIWIETGKFNLTSSLPGKHICYKSVYEGWFWEQQEHAKELINFKDTSHGCFRTFISFSTVFFFSSLVSHTSADSFYCFYFHMHLKLFCCSVQFLLFGGLKQTWPSFLISLSLHYIQCSNCLFNSFST